MTNQGNPPYELEPLIVTAFRMARDRGKVDWRRMTIAVLKNRMLQISRGAFNEKHHDTSSLRELLRRMPTLVRVEQDYVELLENDATRTLEDGVTAEVTDLNRDVHIRPDLWQAVVDYASGKRYAWDEDRGLVRDALPSDQLLLPIVQPEQFATWRAEFVEAQEGAAELTRWRDEGLGTRALPVRLRGKWNGFVKTRVAGFLRAWFDEHGITTELMVPRARPASSRPPSVEDLRRVVAACVAVMTAEEIAELKLPPAAVARAGLIPR